jgi:hypothetical protein
MADHPYRSLPPRAFWRQAVAQVAPEDVNPVASAAFQISREDRVATAGSCFAQHIGRLLRAANFTFLVTEAPHPIVSANTAEAFQYGLFSARYGNIYTARQLRQLLERVTGAFQPADDIWEGKDGSLVDPFRPQIQPGGFLSSQEYWIDRERHFTAVRRAFEELDVFVFTLGLTEAWRSRVDGAVYPLCPGVAGGQYDPATHEFHNFTVSQVVEDLQTFIDGLRSINPPCRIILTVSPVPLIATAQPGAHVLAATVYSKSVLRVAADTVAQSRSNVMYFPSYEIIVGRFDGGTYFESDRRSVTEAGVAHVMRVFFQSFAPECTDAGLPVVTPTVEDTFLRTVAELVKTHCDEEALDPSICQDGT